MLATTRRVAYDAIVRSWPSVWPQWTVEPWDDRAEEHVRHGGAVLASQDVDNQQGSVSFGARLDRFWLSRIADTPGIPADGTVSMPERRYRSL